MAQKQLCLMMASGFVLFVVVGLVAEVSVTTAEAANPHPHQHQHQHPQPHPHPEELQNPLFPQDVLDSGVGGGRGCSYRVRIKTTCRSPRFTRDLVALSFGDAYNNQVYVPRLDDPHSRTFEQCSTDTFDIAGPCGYGICYLYLWRDGPDGWIPDWVEVYDPYYARYVTYHYGSPIPPRVWYGFNHCNHLVSNNGTTATS